MKITLLITVALAAVATAQNKRLISFSEDPSDRTWLTESEILDLALSNVGFIDITDNLEPVDFKVKPSFAFPTTPSFQSVVNPLIAQVSAVELRSFLTDFTSFHNRYYTTQYAVDSAHFLKDYMEAFAITAGRRDAFCGFYNHTWAQPSVYCEITGSTLADEVIIVSAHSDSTAPNMPNGRAPGADDDGSGVASFVEIFRILIQNNFKPLRTIQFFGWAAEEVGLRGSQDIARAYKEQGVNVYAVYQNEMSGYNAVPPGEITILQDYVDTSLTRFLEACVDEYCAIPHKSAICGYGCSDHASWTNQGYAAVCTAEAGPYSSGLNPHYHRETDTVDHLDFNFMAEFTKLSLSAAVELSLFQ